LSGYTLRQERRVAELDRDGHDTDFSLRTITAGRSEKVAAFLLEMDRGLYADHLGLTLEMVSRALSCLRDKRILEFSEVSQREIVLQDRQRLREFVAILLSAIL
jgi:hypothetical protein